MLASFAGLWTAGGLLLFAGLLAAGARWLASARWPHRAPGLGIVAWQSLTLSLALSLVLAAVALVMPQLPAAASMSELVRLCTTALSIQMQHPLTALSAATGLLAVGLLASRFAVVLGRGRVRAHERRRRQRFLLQLLGCTDSNGVTVVDHDVPAVYCVPGLHGRIVATRAATEVLSAVQLRSVLAHERSHLRCRHDLAIAVADAMAQTFLGIRAFELGVQHIAQLVEMQADDAAGRAARPHLAVALLRLSHGPAGVLSAGGVTVERARRLLGPAAPLRALERCAVMVVAALVVGLPVAIGLLPHAGTPAHVCCATPAAAGDATHQVGEEAWPSY